MSEFTAKQLRDFQNYVKVQRSARYNMIAEAGKAMRAAGLDRDSYMFVIKNYEALEALQEFLDGD